MTFGAELTAARAASGLSRQKLASQCGINVKRGPQTIYDYEHDIYHPKPDRIAQLATALNQDPERWILLCAGYPVNEVAE